MKNIFRILGTSLLTTFYCATIIVVIGISQNSNFINKSGLENEKNDLSVSAKLFSNFSQGEISVNTFNNAPPPTLKNSLNEFLAIVKITEQYFANEFSQYISISKNFRIKYRKANIIFPFHYFW